MYTATFFPLTPPSLSPDIKAMYIVYVTYQYVKNCMFRYHIDNGNLAINVNCDYDVYTSLPQCHKIFKVAKFKALIVFFFFFMKYLNYKYLPIFYSYFFEGV